MNAIFDFALFLASAVIGAGLALVVAHVVLRAFWEDRP